MEEVRTLSNWPEVMRVPRMPALVRAEVVSNDAVYYSVLEEDAINKNQLFVKIWVSRPCVSPLSYGGSLPASKEVIACQE